MYYPAMLPSLRVLWPRQSAKSTEQFFLAQWTPFVIWPCCPTLLTICITLFPRHVQQQSYGLLSLIFLVFGGSLWSHSIGTMHYMEEEPIYFEATPPRRTISLLPQSWALLQSRYLATIRSMQMSTARELFWRKVWVLVNAGAFLGELDTLQSIYPRRCSFLT